MVVRPLAWSRAGRRKPDGLAPRLDMVSEGKVVKSASGLITKEKKNSLFEANDRVPIVLRPS
jgi:hypothetical protein